MKQWRRRQVRSERRLCCFFLLVFAFLTHVALSKVELDVLVEEYCNNDHSVDENGARDALRELKVTSMALCRLMTCGAGSIWPMVSS